jgi:hypothetical protein
LERKQLERRKKWMVIYNFFKFRKREKFNPMVEYPNFWKIFYQNWTTIRERYKRCYQIPLIVSISGYLVFYDSLTKSIACG